MSDDQIRDEALTLFLAGHETTANALTWTWYLLSQNPDAEAKLHEELDRICGNPSSGEGVERSRKDTLPSGRVSARAVDFQHLPDLKYTEAVLAESMRLYPPAWAIGRLSIEEHNFGGYQIPKGSLVLASPFVTHRDARFWAEPESFIPERWFEMSIKDAGQRFVYFPFGGGVRRCIGESFAWTEGILAIATLASKWRFGIIPGQKIGLQPMITLRPKFGMKMQIKERG
jgi:cytochrome P450